MSTFGYCRVSGMGQVEGEGLPRQREAIARCAGANNFTVDHIFEEHGVSGKLDWEDRPAWVELMSSAEQGDVIIIERLDRLARDLGVQEHALRELKRRGIAIHSEAEPDLGSADPTRILFRQILGAIAQFDRAMIEAKLRHARDRKRKQDGRCEGRKPFGAREGEAAALQVMADYSKAGFATRTIAEALNRQHLRTRTGKPWSHATVAKILTARATLPLSGAMLPGPAIVRPCAASDPEVHSCPEFS